MGEFDFDRQTFARPLEPEPKPRPPFSIPGSLILLVLVIVGGFAAYQFLKDNDGPGASANSPDLPQIEQRLDALEHRMDQLGRRRTAFRAKPSVTAARQEATDVKSRPSSRHTLSVSGLSPLLDSDSVLPGPITPKPVAANQAKSSPGSGPGTRNDGHSLRLVTSSTQEEWEATANRLGDVVGELATQRNEIDQTQESLDRLSERFGQSSTPFTLEKGGSPQKVGPVRLRLQNADPKNQRYTMRLFIGDESIELKDRALHEAIQFYASGGAGSFELVVSRIRKDGVTGRLSLPVRTSSP